MTEYIEEDVANIPGWARKVIEEQLAVGGYLLRDTGCITNQRFKPVARLSRVVVDLDDSVDWFVQPLRGITIIDFRP